METDPANAKMVKLLNLVWPVLDFRTQRQLKQVCKGFESLEPSYVHVVHLIDTGNGWFKPKVLKLPAARRPMFSAAAS
jgi:hypothetical protein